jgi:hypothetical protein
MTPNPDEFVKNAYMQACVILLVVSLQPKQTLFDDLTVKT